MRLLRDSNCAARCVSPARGKAAARTTRHDVWARSSGAIAWPARPVAPTSSTMVMCPFDGNPSLQAIRGLRYDSGSRNPADLATGWRDH